MKNKISRFIIICFGILFVMIQNGFSIDLKDSIINNIDSNYYSIVDSNARFQNGDINNFRVYIQQNLIVQNEDEIIGKIVFSFKVDWNGDVKNIEIVKSSGVIEFDKQLIKLIQNSPKWIPAIKNNKNVGQSFTIPLIICLQ